MNANHPHRIESLQGARVYARSVGASVVFGHSAFESPQPMRSGWRRHERTPSCLVHKAHPGIVAWRADGGRWVLSTKVGRTFAYDALADLGLGVFGSRIVRAAVLPTVMRIPLLAHRDWPSVPPRARLRRLYPESGVRLASVGVPVEIRLSGSRNGRSVPVLWIEAFIGRVHVHDDEPLSLVYTPFLRGAPVHLGELDTLTVLAGTVDEMLGLARELAPRGLTIDHRRRSGRVIGTVREEPEATTLELSLPGVDGPRRWSVRSSPPQLVGIAE